MSKPEEPLINWDDDADENEATFWGETKIGEVIKEANSQQRSPEEVIKEKKAGVDHSADTSFRTIYEKPPHHGRMRRWLGRFFRSKN